MFGFLIGLSKLPQGKWGTDPHSFLWMSGVGACLPSGPHSRQGEECGALNQTLYCPRAGAKAQHPAAHTRGKEEAGASRQARASLAAQTVETLPTVQEPGFDPRVRKTPWRRACQPSLTFFPGESPWTEEPGRLQSTGSQGVGRDWATKRWD